MKVLIGVDPHKASLAVAAVDEAKGELLQRAAFPQNRAGLRSLERWAKRFPERRLSGGERRRPRPTPGGEVGGLRRVGGGRAAQALGKGQGALQLRWQRPQERWARCPRHRAGRLAQRATDRARPRSRIRGAAPLSERRL